MACESEVGGWEVRNLCSLQAAQRESEGTREQKFPKLDQVPVVGGVDSPEFHSSDRCRT